MASLAPNSGLFTGDLQKDALIDQWSFFASTEIEPFTSYAYLLAKGLVTPYNKPVRHLLIDKFASDYHF